MYKVHDIYKAKMTYEHFKYLHIYTNTATQSNF